MPINNGLKWPVTLVKRSDETIALALNCPETLAGHLRGHKTKTQRIVTMCARWRPRGDTADIVIAQAMRSFAQRARILRKEASKPEKNRGIGAHGGQTCLT